MSVPGPRVLVLGASGLLGSHLVERFPRSFPTVAVSGRSGAAGAGGSVRWMPMRIDSADPASIGSLLAAADPEVVVNAIGAPPHSESALLSEVNTRFPLRLADAARARGARVVQISTDGVFSGARGNYQEEDRPDPADEYGRSKLDGELAAPHLTIRTSFYGRSPRKAGLLEWLVAQRGQAVDGFVDYRFTGIAAPLLADLVASAIEAGLEGVYHVGGDPVTKYDLLCAASARLQLNIAVRPVSRGAVDRTLDVRKFFRAVDRRPPTVAESIEALTPCGVLSRS